jgi:hypothetical protein
MDKPKPINCTDLPDDDKALLGVDLASLPTSIGNDLSDTTEERDDAEVAP